MLKLKKESDEESKEPPHTPHGAKPIFFFSLYRMNEKIKLHLLQELHCVTLQEFDIDAGETP